MEPKQKWAIAAAAVIAIVVLIIILIIVFDRKKETFTSNLTQGQLDVYNKFVVDSHANELHGLEDKLTSIHTIFDKSTDHQTFTIKMDKDQQNAAMNDIEDIENALYSIKSIPPSAWTKNASFTQGMHNMITMPQAMIFGQTADPVWDLAFSTRMLRVMTRAAELMEGEGHPIETQW